MIEAALHLPCLQDEDGEDVAEDPSQADGDEEETKIQGKLNKQEWNQLSVRHLMLENQTMKMLFDLVLNLRLVQTEGIFQFKIPQNWN